ncbi:MAG: ABC transporter permease [Patescibacteria group bacterium]|nr:ABC transporter permease [Patescibacteria group bacterium]MDD5715940.1 ABC transporter permease [Patescibacteria group bacterium]
MKEIFRNMWRRKMRTILTVFGIAIGIFAFTVMGSMSLKINKMISGGKRYITGQITIMPKGSSADTYGMMGGASFLALDTLNKIAEVDGVKAVTGGVSLALKEVDLNDPESQSMSFGMPATIEGMDLNSAFENRNWNTIDMKEGHMITQDDPDTAITIGYTIAGDNNLKTGDTFQIRGTDFQVVGIADQTLTGPDQYVFMGITKARELLVEATPFLKSLKERADEAGSLSEAALAALPEATRKEITEAKAFKMEDVNQMAAVSWEDGQDSDVVANRIKDQFKDEAVVLSPKMLGEQIDKASAIFNTMILGSALIALIVGGFSIINTMIMSISERTKEIGIKKALGASRKAIAYEYTLEAGVIGLIGGCIGMGFGVLLASILNSKTSAEIFMLSLNFLGGVVAFSFVLGIIAGIIPAIKASRMKAVDAIREL